MRITQTMLTRQILSDIQNNYTRMSQLQSQAASGKRINKPSDDPVGVGFVLRYKDELASYQQYQSNAGAAQSWLKYTDSTMQQADTVMQRLRDLAVQGASDTFSPDDRKAMASEVGQLYDQLVSIANTQFSGQYIFNGQLTTQAPYPQDKDPATVVTDTGSVLYDIGDARLPVNVSGNSYFGAPSDADNAFAVAKQLEDALNNNDAQAISDVLGKIDSRYNQMLAVQANVGAREDRVQLAQNRLQDMTQNITSLLSNTEDADMAKVIVDLQAAENVHTASLLVASRVIQPTLVDFLK
ncbi:MAG: flagellar hook-associated protein FlgL [Alicyclobacillus herbarius]|uniref:flagellar hook-associated protein FlgL n=1 Tax=Alicyclobacillus herbarius TaxID=122960 RepID=UPI00047DE416|nr:flagellar hook-associated protein FlgL [Alicyclobacillus herbarius]